MNLIRLSCGMLYAALLLNTACIPATPVEPPSAQRENPTALVRPATASATAPAFPSSQGNQDTAALAPPPVGQIYHGVYPGGVTGEEDDLTPKDLRTYEKAAGKQAAWVYFSHNWYHGRHFPAETAAWIRSAGSIPFVRLMLRSDPEQDHAEPLYTLERILEGKFDPDLRVWMREAGKFGSPLLAEYGTEVNGEWFPWNGIWNGSGVKDGYGSPQEYDGAERFRDAYRHIIEIARTEGAHNVEWVFHINHQDAPAAEWNRLENYYPGDAWIDWIGVSVYGAQTPLEDEWLEFRPQMDAAYPRLAALSPQKPLLLLEFGAAAEHPHGDQARWADAALNDIGAGRWPRLAGFAWWNEWWQNNDNPAHDTNMRLQDNPALAAIFRRRVGGNAAVLGRPLLEP